MRRLSGALLAALLAAACTGLWVDKGNDYPCDFRAPEGERDQVCAPGEVCGVDNLCRPFHYEGPQFEGRPPLPRLDAGARLHPGQLDADVKAVALNGSFEDQGKERTLWVLTGGGRLFHLDRSRPGAVVTDVTGFLQGRTLLGAAVAERDRAVALVSGSVATETLAVQLALDGGRQPVREGALPLGDVRGLRTHQGRVVALRASGVNPFAGALAGDVHPVTGAFAATPLEVRLDDGGTADGGLAVFDVAVLKPGAFVPPALVRPVGVALTPAGLWWVDEAAGPLAGVWTSLHLSQSEADEVSALAGPGARLRSDLTGRLLAFANGATLSSPAPRRVLSTWSLVRASGRPQAARAWPDCAPCGGGVIAAFAPAFSGQPVVEVLCASARGAVSAVRVVGSSASTPQQACELESLATGFEPGRVAQVPPRSEWAGLDAGVGFELVQDFALSSAVALGSTGGRVYVGATFSAAGPVFLDRLPVATGSFLTPDGRPVLAALTDQYAAVRVGEEGFEVFDPLAETGLRGAEVSALVGEAPGWMVLSTGDLMKGKFDAASPDGKVQALFGPRLLNASDLAVQGPFKAEAVTESDGGVRAVVLTAFDSVYLARDLGGASLTEAPNALPPLRPDLTPEPNSPIRSFALERSVLGTDGLQRVRGYAATARNLYLVQYGGAPARWSASPLVLTGESPVEVWMDHPRGGLGRVGYPSGEVYTLPGAFLLARSLAESGVLEGLDAGVQVAAEDYENLAGWPVAYTRAGAFVASYPVLPDGGLDNKLSDGRLGKPMTWRRVQLFDGREPWLGKPGRLHVQKGPRVLLDAAGGRFTEEWTLVIFTPDEVYEAAFATRSNAQ